MEVKKGKTMKQSATTSCTKESSLLALATEDEVVVSQILLDLRNLMSLSAYLEKFNWICRRRRSSLDAPPPLPAAPAPQPPSVQRTDDGIEETRPQIKAEMEVEEEKGDAGRTTASPDTPLSFSPSESDVKSKHSSKKTSRKRTKEYMDMIEGLTQRKELLIGEIQNVKKYYKKLKAYNSKLKAKKQEMLNSCPRKEEPQMERINLGMELTQHYRIDMVHHQQPSTADPTVRNFPYPYGPITAQLFPSNNGLGSLNQVGPLGFDLNIPAEEAFGGEPSQPLDLNMALADQRARCAEARRKRRGILKIKAMRNACGIKLPTSI